MTGNHGKFYSYKISSVIQLNFSSGIQNSFKEELARTNNMIIY